MVIELSDEKKKELTMAELEVIQWLNNNEELIPDRSISEMADESYTSPATVSRAIRKCGFSGIAELKYRVSAKMNYVAEGKIVNEIFQRSLMECEKTIEILKVETILRIIKYIKCSEKIYIIARGTTALIARDFEFQLQLLGYNAYLISDSQIMKRSEKLFKHDDLIIIFSIKNSTPELAMTAKAAKEKGAMVVSCCCKQETPLDQYADLSVFGYDQKDSPFGEFAIISRLPLYIISRTLIDYLTL